MVVNRFHPTPDRFNPNARTAFAPICTGCGLVFHDEIGYHEPSPEGCDGHVDWCRPCAPEMGVEGR